MNYYLGPYQWLENSWQPPASTVGSIDLRNLTHMGTPVVQDGYGFFATIDPVRGYDLLGRGDLREINSTRSMKSMWDSLLGYSPNGDKLVDLLYDHLTMGSDPTGANTCKPLTPTKGNLALQLGGHGRVKTTQFRIGHSPESNQVLSVYQEDYRQIRQLSIDGKLPVNQHRKVLDYWADVFRVTDPQQVFIPSNLPIELPLPHDTSISENFDGADNAVIGKQLTWVEPGDGSFWDNANSRGRMIDENATTEDEQSCYANSALSGTNQQCSVTQAVHTSSGGGGAAGGPTCRRSNAAVTYYYFRLLENNSLVRLGKLVAGVRTQFGSNVAVTVSIPDVLKLQVIGSSLEGFFNDVSKSTETDTAITGNLFCGLRSFVTTLGDVEFDDWAAEDLASDPTGSPCLLLEF